MEWRDLSLKNKFFGTLSIVVKIVAIVGVMFFTSFITLDASAQRQMADSDLSVSILQREIKYLQWVNALSSHLAVGDARSSHQQRWPWLRFWAVV